MGPNGLNFNSNYYNNTNLYPDKLNPGRGNYNSYYPIDAYFDYAQKYNNNNNYNYYNQSLYSDVLNPGVANFNPVYELDKYFGEPPKTENLYAQYESVDTSAVEKALTDPPKDTSKTEEKKDTSKTKETETKKETEKTKETDKTKETEKTKTDDSKKTEKSTPSSVVVTKWGTTDKNGKRQDCLWNIAKNNYGLTDNKAIMKKVDEIIVYHNAHAKEKGLRVITNADLIYTGETILLP